MILSLFVGFVLGAAALLFAIQNTTAVALTFLGWQFTSSLAVVVASVVVGILISILATLPAALSRTFRIMGLKKENKNLVQEVETHRNARATLEQSVEESGVIDLRK
jgi:uncharacterized integral membrane protein